MNYDTVFVLSVKCYCFDDPNLLREEEVGARHVRQLSGSNKAYDIPSTSTIVIEVSLPFNDLD